MAPRQMPLISVIIPAYGHCPHLSALVRAILGGTVAPDEIIISHTGPGDPTGSLETSERVRILHQEKRLLGGGARNRGAEVARGEWFAFVDADVLPRADWLERLVTAVEAARGRFVVGSVGVATSGGYWGLCNWLCEFSEQAPWRAARSQRGGASCNMIVRAEDHREAGGFPSDYQPAEDTMLFARLNEMGRTQWFEPAARVDHHNQSGLRSFARHQYRLGYHSALVRQLATLRGSIAARIWPLALGIWIPRLALIGRRAAAGGPGWWLRGLVLGPGLVLGSWIWAFGFLKRAQGGKTVGGPKSLGAPHADSG